ncbi:MAG: anti-sigma factor family protein [Planctomyces sp.]|jgi:hypothetical protein
MNCADARHLIHLDAGNDLHSEEEHDLAGHMECCADCRSYHSRMLQAMSALQALRDFDTEVSVSGRGLSEGSRSSSSVKSSGSGSHRVSSDSWAALASRLPPRSRTRPVTRRFNMQVAVLSVCSLALAVVTTIQALPTANTSLSSVAVPERMSGTPVYWGNSPSVIPAGYLAPQSLSGGAFSDSEPQNSVAIPWTDKSEAPQSF